MNSTVVYPSHPLASSNFRLIRAYEHIEAFEGEMDAFIRSKPHEILTEVNNERTEYVYRARVYRVPPTRLSLIVGDAIHNLRASLDNLVWPLSGMPTGKERERIEFPIYDDRTRYQSTVNQKLFGVDPRAAAMIERLQPYNALGTGPRFGPPLLMVLQHLSNFEKHRALHFIWSATIRARVDVEEIPIGQEMRSALLEDGAELARFKFARPDINMNVSFEFVAVVQVAEMNTVVPVTYLRGIANYIRLHVLPEFKDYFMPRGSGPGSGWMPRP